MPKPIASYIFICKELIKDKNDLYSAIKIADAFLVEPTNAAAEEEGKAPISVTTFFMLAHIVSVKDAVHQIRVTLAFPSGRVDEVMSKEDMTIGERIPGVPGGITLVGAMTVVPEEMGTHFIKLEVDGEISAIAPFTFVYKTSTQPDPRQ